MSKNHPNDNIYSILGKLDALKPTTQEQHDATVKQIYESVEAQGSILSGVSKVEATLNEKYMGFKAVEKSAKAGGAENSAAVAAAVGRKKYGKEKFQKAAAKGKKMGEQNMGPGTGGMEEDIGSFGGAARESALDEKAPPGLEKLVRKLKKEYPGHEEKAFATAWSVYNKKHGKKEESREPCAECAMDENYVHKGTYGTSYYKGDDYDDEKSYRSAKEEPKVAAEPKGRGRPKKADSERSSAKLPQFGKGKYELPVWPKGKTTVHKIAESLSTVGQRLVEGINFKAMAEETNQTIDELLSELQKDIGEYKVTGHCSDKLKDFLHVHSHSKKQMADEAAKVANAYPVGTDAMSVNPELRAQKQNAITPSDNSIMGKIKDTAHHAGRWLAGKPEIGRTYEEESAVADPLEEELKKLAELAGIRVADEGNAFTGKLKSTPRGGKFDLDGKSYTDTSSLDEEPEMEGNAFSGKLAQAKAQHKDTFDVDGKEYEVKEADAPVDEPVEEPVNGPKEKYSSMRASTLNPGEGDFGEKNMYGGKGDNRMTQQPNRPAKPVKSVATLEARLAAEYESIKKVSK